MRQSEDELSSAVGSVVEGERVIDFELGFERKKVNGITLMMVKIDDEEVSEIFSLKILSLAII